MPDSDGILHNVMRPVKRDDGMTWASRVGGGSWGFGPDQTSSVEGVEAPYGLIVVREPGECGQYLEWLLKRLISWHIK